MDSAALIPDKLRLLPTYIRGTREREHDWQLMPIKNVMTYSIANSFSRLLHCRSPKKKLCKTRSKPENKEASPADGSKKLLYRSIAGLATVGGTEALYLTMSKYLNVQVLCPTSGCESVINGPYSEIFGIPLSLLGIFGYSFVLYCARDCVFSDKDKIMRKLLLTGTTLMASCSGVLMYTLLTKLDGEFCLWCYLSATLSVSMFVLSLLTVPDEERMSFLMPSGLVGVTVAALMLTIFSGIDESAAASDLVIEYQDPEVTAKSTEESISLAKRLKGAGVKMLGAFWCNHCYDQKQTFGKEAMEFFPYVECFPNGYRKGVELAKECTDANIDGYPTWIFGDKKIPGEQSLEDLERDLREMN